MTTVAQGDTTLLVSQWFEFEGGPAVDLDTNPTVGIVNLGTGAVVLAPTSVGVIHTVVGGYAYNWATAVDLPAGTYVVSWAGLVDGAPVTAAETVTVTTPIESVPPCGWTIDRCGCGSCWAGHTPAVRAHATALAVHIMWTATGRRYGPCQVTVLPCNPRPADPLYQTFGVGGYDPWSGGNGGMYPALEGGRWFNRCGSGCTCSAVCEVALDGPVASVVEVTIDGEVVPPGAYEIHDGHKLVRVDGDCWPSCQVYGVEIPGFTVTYNRGVEIPGAVRSAVELLACEFAKACTGGVCRLPDNLASLSREGVDITVASVPVGGSGLVHTGIKIVDDIIAADNPYALVEARLVYSPDAPTSRMVTWQGGS